jgi:hypothetical protein
MQNRVLQDIFKGESFAGLLYLASMDEKANEDALFYLYQKPTSCTSTFQKARKLLMDNNALESRNIYGKKGLISVLRAKPEPYLAYLSDRVKECNKHKQINLDLSDIEIRYLKFIFNSRLFRKAFFNVNLFGKPEYAYNVSLVLDHKGRAHAYDIFRWIDNIFITMTPYLRELYVNGFEDLFLDDIRTFLDYEYPDEFVNARMSAVPEERAKQVKSYCNDFLSSTFGKYPHVQYMLNNVVANNFFTVFNYKFLAKLYVIMDFDSGLSLTDTFIEDL